MVKGSIQESTERDMRGLPDEGRTNKERWNNSQMGSAPDNRRAQWWDLQAREYPWTLRSMPQKEGRKMVDKKEQGKKNRKNVRTESFKKNKVAI